MGVVKHPTDSYPYNYIVCVCVCGRGGVTMQGGGNKKINCNGWGYKKYWWPGKEGKFFNGTALYQIKFNINAKKKEKSVA